MAFAGTSAITELWAKCKAWFANKLGSSTTATTVSISLKNNAEDTLATTSISAATTTSAGVMSADDKTKLDGIASGANAYTHPAYTAQTGKPTANQAPAFGGTVTVSQIASDANGHVTGAVDRTITIPNAAASTEAAGLMSAADKTKLNGIAAGATANTGTVTKVSTGVGLTGGDISTTGTVKAKLRSETALTNDSVAAAETAGRIYPVAQDKSGYLAVNVPWVNDNDDTKVTNTLAATTKAYVTGTSSATTNTGTQVFDDAVYLGTTAGSLYATTFYGGGSGLTSLNASNLSNGTVPVERLSTTAVAKGGTGATTAADARTNLGVYSKSEVDSLVLDAAKFQGTVEANTTISGSSYKKGMYWVVKTAGTYVGQSCEVGDMIFCIKTKATSYDAGDFSVVQNNIVEMTTAEVDAICV